MRVGSPYPHIKGKKASVANKHTAPLGYNYMKSDPLVYVDEPKANVHPACTVASSRNEVFPLAR